MSEKEIIADAVSTMEYILDSLGGEHQLPDSVIDDINRFISENKITKEPEPEESELLYYLAPDGSTISINDYEFLSSSQQSQCKRVTKLPF